MNYKQSNWLIDTVMPAVKEANAFKVIAAVARMTWGWQREWADITFDDLQKMTGVASRETLTKAVKDALESRYIKREKWGKSFRYSMARSTETVPDHVQDQYGNRTGDSTETVPSYVNGQYGNRTDDSTETVPQTSTETVPSSIKENKERKKVKQKERDYPVPVVLATPEFLNVWGEWLQYHAEHGRPLTFGTTKRQLDQLMRYPANVAAEMVEQSIANNWTGLFEIKSSANGRHLPAKKDATTERLMARLKAAEGQ